MHNVLNIPKELVDECKRRTRKGSGIDGLRLLAFACMIKFKYTSSVLDMKRTMKDLCGEFNMDIKTLKSILSDARRCCLFSFDDEKGLLTVRSLKNGYLRKVKTKRHGKRFMTYCLCLRNPYLRMENPRLCDVKNEIKRVLVLQAVGFKDRVSDSCGKSGNKVLRNADYIHLTCRSGASVIGSSRSTFARLMKNLVSKEEVTKKDGSFIFYRDKDVWREEILARRKKGYTFIETGKDGCIAYLPNEYSANTRERSFRNVIVDYDYKEGKDNGSKGCFLCGCEDYCILNDGRKISYRTQACMD